jgi:hypothetical protein
MISQNDRTNTVFCNSQIYAFKEGIALSGRPRERCPVKLIHQFDISALIKKEPHYGNVPSRGGQRQRRSAVVVSRVNIGIIKQQLHNSHMPVLGNIQQWRSTVNVSRVNIGFVK